MNFNYLDNELNQLFEIKREEHADGLLEVLSTAYSDIMTKAFNVRFLVAH